MTLLSSFPKGKVQLEIGVQSTNPDVLKRVSRHSDLPVLLDRLERLHAFGNLHIHTDLIAGLPGEDFSSVARSFNALYGRCDLLQLGFLKLLRGSVLRDEAESFGCLYSDEPPYMVLATDRLSFAELERLHQIDDLINRLDASDSFTRTMKLLTERSGSPFSLYEALSLRFEADGLHLDALAQPRLFEKLYEYAQNGNDPKLAEALSLDFSCHQNSLPPRMGSYRMIRPDDSAILNGETVKELKNRFLRFARENELTLFIPSLEVRVLTASDALYGIYICDRRGGRIFMTEGESFTEV